MLSSVGQNCSASSIFIGMPLCYLHPAAYGRALRIDFDKDTEKHLNCILSYVSKENEIDCSVIIQDYKIVECSN